MKKLFTYFSWTVIAIIFLLALVIFYWEIKPYKILEFQEGNGTILNKVVEVGDFIQIRQVQCKFQDIHADLNRQFVDTLIYYVNPITTNRPVGCFDTVEYVYIPRLLPSGKYKIHTIISYQVNPVRKIEYEVTTDEFEIVNKIIK